MTRWHQRSILSVLAGMALVMALCGAAIQNVPAADSDRLSQALREFNRGSALLEQYRYADAAKALEKAVEAFPDWTAARFNLGVAYLNMQADKSAVGVLDKARKAFEDVVTAEPGNLHALYCLGLYHQFLMHNKEALAYFEKVQKADPRDPHVAYKCAEVLSALRRNDDAIKMLEHAIAVDPGFVSAYYQLGMLYLQKQQRDKAMPVLQRFQPLQAEELAGGSFAVKQQTYGTVGKYGVLLEANRLPLAAAAAPRPRILFSPEVKKLDARLKPWKWAGGTVNLPGVAVGDLRGNGSLDLVLTGIGENGGTQVFLNDGKGNFTAGPQIADQGVCPSLGDVNNDGHLDLWLGRAGQDILFLNDGKGKLTKAPAPAIPADKALTACARLLDLDSDGDLDLLSLRWRAGSVPAAGDVAGARNRLYNNNRDGTWNDLAEKLGLALGDSPIATAICDDFDNDRDLDLLLFPAKGSPIAWENHRAGKYRLLDGKTTGLEIEGVVGAVTGDPFSTGKRDLLVFTGKTVQFYRNRGNWRFELDEDFSDRFSKLGGTGGQFADIDNDGNLDLVIADAHRSDGTRGPVLLLNDPSRRRFVDATDLDSGNLLAAIKTPGDASCVVADFNGDGKLDILLAAMNEQPMLIENRTQGGHYVALDLRGVRDGERKGRSNNSAIGARVEVKSGSVIQQHVVGVPSGPVAAPPLQVHVGLGPNPEIQWLRILWPDSVLQAELELAADRTLKITEVPRKTSSCPHLFAWNGTRFEFIADFGGVGGLGYLAAPGVYAQPDPTEYLPIPGLQPKNGEYVLQVVEPLEEVVYFDEAKLIAVDHPIGTEIAPNEMAAVNAAPPPFEIFCYREPISPVKAVDHRGVDVTEQVLRADRQCAGPTELDGRFHGYAADHYVDLDFGDRLEKLGPDVRLVLFLQGWVEYAYSQTNFAAAQAGLRLKAPSVSVLRKGRWVELFHEVGYPAGVQHTMTLDLTGKLQPGDRKLRVATNMEISWDRIFLAPHLGAARPSIKEVAARSADLHFLGYPREYSPDGRQPTLLDYDSVDRSMPWKQMKGQYTRYGEVGELLGQADDRYVIMAPGDEVTLRFPADAFGPVPAGCRRTFLLKADSYCKDMDLYTAYPDTVEPLPFHGMSGYPYRADEHYPDNAQTRDYRERFNTRTIGGR